MATITSRPTSFALAALCLAQSACLCNPESCPALYPDAGPLGVGFVCSKNADCVAGLSCTTPCLTCMNVCTASCDAGPCPAGAICGSGDFCEALCSATNGCALLRPVCGGWSTDCRADGDAGVCVQILGE